MPPATAKRFKESRLMVEIHWERWQKRPVMSHFDPSCAACAFLGPLTDRFGKTRRPAMRYRQLVRRSRIAEGIRPKSVTKWQPPGWVRTYYAVRCPSCGEQYVYRRSALGLFDDEVEELYVRPNFDRAVTEIDEHDHP